MDMDLMIKNSKIINSDRIFTADIGIENGKIVKIAKNLKLCAKRVINAKGMIVLPGAIDVHVHNNYFFCGTYSEDWDTGTAGGACGGVTTCIDYAIQKKGTTLKEAVEDRLKDAKDKACIDYSLHLGITDWNEKTKDEMYYYTCNGIPSFKMWLTYREEGLMADDGVLFSALEETKKSGALLMLHCESAFVLDMLIERYHTKDLMMKHGAYCHTLSRPCFTEYEAIQRAITWAKVTDGRLYIVHVSTGEGTEIINQAKKEGVKVWAETCPQYLLLTDDVFRKKNGHYYATCPQVKKSHDRIGLIKGIKSGVIQNISTDTCTFSTNQKDIWGGDFTKIPYGLPGMETRIPTMFTYLVGESKLSIRKFVSLISTNPAKLFGLYPQKGIIEVGSDADIVIFDPKKEVIIDYKNLTTKCDWSPYQGMKLVGYPYITISRGNIVAKEGKFVGKYGMGKFVKRKPGGVI